MHRDRRAGLEALGKIVPLQHPRHGVLGRQLDHAARTKRIRPFRVIANFRARRVQHQTGLGKIGLRVFFDLLRGKRRTGDIASRRIADHRGEITNQKNHVMAEILQLAHFVEHDGMPEVQIRRSRIESELDAQRRTRLF